MNLLVAQTNWFLEQKRARWRRAERVRVKLSSWALKEKVREKKRGIGWNFKQIEIHRFRLQNCTHRWFRKHEMSSLSQINIVMLKLLRKISSLKDKQD